MPQYLHQFWKYQRRSILIWITVIFISVDLGTARGPPRITGTSTMPDKSGHITVRDSPTLTLKCEGEDPVTWKIVHQRKDIAERTELDDFSGQLNKNNKYKYQSIVTVTYPVYTDTGLFICHYKDSMESTRSDDKAEIYVFVEDWNHILLPADGSYGDDMADHMPTISPIQNISTHLEMEAIIPCLPTSPNVKVTIWKVTGDNARQLLELTFDPTKGFIIPSVTDVYGGKIYCIAKLREVTNQRDFFVTIIPTSAPVMITTNLNNAEYRVSAYKRFKFQCVGHGVPQPVVKWYRKVAGVEQPIDDTGIQILDNGTTLDIARPIFKDSGLYICELRNSVGFIRGNATLIVIDIMTRPHTNRRDTIVIVSVFGVIIVVTLVVAGIFFGRRLAARISLARRLR